MPALVIRGPVQAATGEAVVALLVGALRTTREDSALFRKARTRGTTAEGGDPPGEALRTSEANLEICGEWQEPCPRREGEENGKSLPLALLMPQVV